MYINYGDVRFIAEYHDLNGRVWIGCYIVGAIPLGVHESRKVDKC